MADVVVLIRHGKAQTRSDERPDFERTLTKAGKRSLVAWLSRSAHLLAEEGPQTVELWSSPAARAMETAALVASAYADELDLKKFDVIEKPFLWSQDLAAFFGEVRACEADVVVAVGHNPFMEQACAQVCGREVPLATGGTIAMRVSDDERFEGRLLWMMQGPESKRWKTMVDIEDIIASAVDGVETKREAFFADPADVEAAHKYRVSIRTIRGLLAFVEPFIQKDSYIDMQRDWKYLVNCTSRLREYDVLAEEVAQLEPPAETLLAACHAARDEECTKTLAFLDTKKARACFKRVCKASRNLLWRRRHCDEGLDYDAIPVRFAEIVEDERADVASLDLADVERTHDVRKQAKQVRYAAEKFKSLVGHDAEAVSEEMKAVQNRLGALCDARVNVDIIDEFTKKDLPDEAMWALSLLRAQNEQYIYSTLRG